MLWRRAALNRDLCELQRLVTLQLALIVSGLPSKLLWQPCFGLFDDALDLHRILLQLAPMDLALHLLLKVGVRLELWHSHLELRFDVVDVPIQFLVQVDLPRCLDVLLGLLLDGLRAISIAFVEMHLGILE